MKSAAGRFAPSPTGPLHFGSLLAATASYLDARSRDERWLLRVDDLDVHRNVSGAEAAILGSLEAHALLWDGAVIRQSDRIERYEAALETLAALDLTFYCTCSRRQLQGQPTYPGTCRAHTRPRADAAIRILSSGAPITFTDLIAGTQSDQLSGSCGDFIVRRRDGLIAYQLATAVDDGAVEITRVIRGGDLLDNTARQIHIMNRLGLSAPRYGHLPLLSQPDGMKLSKQTHAPALDDGQPAANLSRIFPYLHLDPPADSSSWSAPDLLRWAVENWSTDGISTRSVVFRH